MSSKFHHCQVHGINQCNGHHHYPHIHHPHLRHLRHPEPEWLTYTKIGFVAVGVICAVTGIDPLGAITTTALSALGGGKQS